MLVDLEVDVDLVLADPPRLRRDLRQVVALVDIEVVNLLGVAFDLGAVEDGLALEVEDGVDLVDADAAGARHIDLADGGFLDE